MEFSYSNLKSADQGGNRVGNWKGRPVFASMKMDLGNRGTGVFFIVYDDNNLIVKKDDYDAWWIFGQVSEEGAVEECDKKRYDPFATAYCATGVEAARQVYCHDTQTYEPAAHAVCGKSDAECNGTVADYAEVVADVQIGINVDATLKAAREMTVESLLEGFNYGLDAKG